MTNNNLGINTVNKDDEVKKRQIKKIKSKDNQRLFCKSKNCQLWLLQIVVIKIKERSALNYSNGVNASQKTNQDRVGRIVFENDDECQKAANDSDISQKMAHNNDIGWKKMNNG